MNYGIVDLYVKSGVLNENGRYVDWLLNVHFMYEDRSITTR